VKMFYEESFLER